ncbi:hypothetical protein M2175_003870 [Bradyrhizobium elkanii]|nr:MULTISPECIES: hypothetical protein [Bradyrhizobium]MCS3928839.1 hypothetical protein [Bradyrhizobium elkanii]MCS3969393.1 hypothetical protein [Bradyrhizobium japonicum]
MSGIVIAKVGSRVRRLRVGDEVYSYNWGNPKGGFYAEYVGVPADKVAPIPKRLVDLWHAGAIPITGLTALHGIDDALGLKRAKPSSFTAPRAASEGSRCNSQGFAAPGCLLLHRARKGCNWCGRWVRMPQSTANAAMSTITCVVLRPMASMRSWFSPAETGRNLPECDSARRPCCVPPRRRARAKQTAPHDPDPV